MAKTINDPVFGELEYNEKGYWIRKISLSMWGVDEEIDLMIKCGSKEEIIDDQRNAYRYYLESLKKIEKLIPDILFSYYNDHYEDIARERDVEDDEELRKDSVSKLVVLDYSDIQSLFIDRNGDYGWLVEFIWNDYPISVILSEENVKIYEGWNILKENYTKADDTAFGEMVYDYSWQKSVKMDLYGVKGKWINVVASADPGESINEAQRKAYLACLEKEEDYLDEIPHAMITYYLENYEDIEEWNDIPVKYNKQNITMDSVMELLNFKQLYFDEEGRYGWLCDCLWDSSGLAIILSGDEIEVTVQDELIV